MLFYTVKNRDQDDNERDLARKCKPEDVAEYLRERKISEEIIDNFLAEEVNGLFLLGICQSNESDILLNDLGVTSPLQRLRICSHFEDFLRNRFL